MHLRSDRYLSGHQDPEITSRVPTLGSGTRLVGNLEGI